MSETAPHQRDETMPRDLVVFSHRRERLGMISLWADLIRLRRADPQAQVILGRHPAAYLSDDDAWLTLHRTCRLSDYMSDDYAYRQGSTWMMARPSRRLPRGVC
jgi:hypothetical protein